MPAGRPPKPTALKLIAGNPGKRPLNKNEPTPDLLYDLVAPLYLPEAAKQVWDELAPMLKRVRLLTEVDAAMLAMGCIAIANYRSASKLAPPDRLLVKNASNGQIGMNPALIAQSMSFKQSMAVLREFGMSPTSRARVAAGMDEKKINPFLVNAK